MQIVKGPDFPTGATILGKRGIEEAYRTGRGKIKVRSVTNIEPMANGKNRIVVTELPYLVNKARLIEKIAELVRDKKIDGITDLRDESDRQGMRIVIELRRDVNPQIMVNQLYKHTQLQDSFGVIMLALVNNEPKVLNLKEMLGYYLDHQKEVVTRRTKFDLNKAEERAHILEGLLIALDNIDEVIQIVRTSETVQISKQRLMERFGLSDPQSQAIVDMRIRALTGLEREKLEQEYKDLQVRIGELKAILGDVKKLLGVIREEITIIADKYGDDRRTTIGIDDEAADFSLEDLIPDENTVVALTNLGYIKRMSVSNFRSQNRGGKGIKGMQTLEDDYITELMMTTNHHYMLFFTNTGKVYRLKTYEIPEASRTSRGVAVVNLIQLGAGEKITAMIPVREFEEDKYLFMATRKGVVKKTPVSEYGNIRKTGLTAINLKEEDELIEVKITDGNRDVLLVTSQGQCTRFQEENVRPTGRVSMGVIGMKLEEEDEVIGMQLDNEGDHLLIVSENGMGKRTDIHEFTVQNRGGKGVKCYKISDKTGHVVGMKAVSEGQEILIITTEGIIIRISVDSISILGRITSGVKLISMNQEDGKDIRVASISKVREDPKEKEEIEEEDTAQGNESDTQEE
jgi:DNA gyrase subunit A